MKLKVLLITYNFTENTKLIRLILSVDTYFYEIVSCVLSFEKFALKL